MAIAAARGREAEQAADDEVHLAGQFSNPEFIRKMRRLLDEL